MPEVQDNVREAVFWGGGAVSWRMLGAPLAAFATLLGVAGGETIRGTVSDRGGRALAGIEVRLLGPREAAEAARPRIASATSDGEGRFALAADRTAAKLIELAGPQGAGRVRVETSAAPLALVYPVRATVVLLHDNDHHFNFNHREAVAAKIDAIRSRHRHVFLLSAGDVFIRHANLWNEPSPEFYARQSRGIIAEMNAFGYDAMTLGNHELDYIDDLTREALAQARFPLLSANVTVSTDRLPQPQPYTVLTTDNDLTVAVLGLSVANPKEGVAMRDAIEAAREFLPLADEHDVFVALTHIGYRTDRRLAEAVDRFDVIIGGHSHTLLEEAEVVGGVLVAQAGGTAADRPNPVDPARPRYLGKVVLVLENGAVVEKRGRVFTFTGDPSAEGDRGGTPALSGAGAE